MSTFSDPSNSSSPLVREKTGAWGGLFAFAICLIPFAIGFGFPVAQLIRWAALTVGSVLKPAFIEHLVHSLLLSIVTAGGLAAIALIFCYSLRLHSNPWNRLLTRLATIGYAAPGAVVAVGVMVSLAAIDRQIVSPSIHFSGTLLAIVFAYLIRFLTVAYEPISAGMTKVCRNLDEASRVLGKSPLTSLLKIDLPLLRGTLLAATTLVFVDILKELPLTMILRPANFETLATISFGLAKEGRIYESAVPSLIIVIAGGIGLLILNRFIRGASSR